MYLILVMSIYFTIRDVQLIRNGIRSMKNKRKLPELQEPKEPEELEEKEHDG